jgi:hypothetical protein
LAVYCLPQLGEGLCAIERAEPLSNSAWERGDGTANDHYALSQPLSFGRGIVRVANDHYALSQPLSFGRGIVRVANDQLKSFGKHVRFAK